MTGAPAVDVIIAVHNPERPVDRAVRSVLTGTDADIRVTVVCHNTSEAGIAARLGALVDDDRVRMRSINDGIPSPSGPFNAGLDAADGTFTSVMGSDDTLEPGAIDSWLALARRSASDMVVTRLRHAAGAAVPTPPTRPWRTTGLDGVRDRLSYRSAPLGLVRRARFGDLRFASQVTVGEDLPYVSQLWFSGAPVAFDRYGPAYVIGDDAIDRVTFAPRSIDVELGYLPHVFDAGWFAALSVEQRHAIVLKFLRIHIFGAVHNRPDPAWWSSTERRSLQIHTRLVRAHGKGVDTVLSRADHRVLEAIDDLQVPSAELIAASLARRRFLRPAAILPANLSRLAHREAPLRMMAASWWAARG